MTRGGAAQWAAGYRSWLSPEQAILFYRWKTPRICCGRTFDEVEARSILNQVFTVSGMPFEWIDSVHRGASGRLVGQPRRPVHRCAARRRRLRHRCRGRGRGFVLELAQHRSILTVALGGPADTELLERLGAWRVLLTPWMPAVRTGVPHPRRRRSPWTWRRSAGGGPGSRGPGQAVRPGQPGTSGGWRWRPCWAWPRWPPPRRCPLACEHGVATRHLGVHQGGTRSVRACHSCGAITSRFALASAGLLLAATLAEGFGRRGLGAACQSPGWHWSGWVTYRIGRR
jgi:hypothetical protein